MPAAAVPRPVVDPRTGLRADGGPEPDRLALLGTLQEAFAAAVLATDPGAPVPACGDWTARELVVHLAGVHHWAAGMAAGDDTRAEDLPVPDGGPEALADLYGRHAAELRAVLAAVGPAARASTLVGDGPVGDGPASFWRRRQVHETLVHLHDLHAARLGSGPAVVTGDALPVAPEVWADCVDEIVTMFQPRQVRLGRMAPLPEPVRLVAADLGWSWTLGAHDGGSPDDEAGRRRPAATLSAPAHGLALLLWGRLDPAGAGATVDGDDAVVRRALGAPVVP